MKIWSNRIILMLISLFVLSQLFSSQYIVMTYTILTAAVMLISIFYSRGLSKIFGSMMVLIGVIILLVQQQDAEVWMEAITKNLPLICLIILVPILAIPINLGNYPEKLAEFASRFSKRSQLYLFISGLFTIIGPITNIGAIPIIHMMLEKLKLPPNLLARVYARGLTSVHTWAPYFASVFLVVYSLQIPISVYIPYGLFLSALQIMTAYLLFSLIESRYIKMDPIRSTKLESPKKIYELFAVIMLITGCIFFLERIVPINASILIGLIVLLFAGLWSFYLDDIKSFFIEANLFRKSIMPARANEVGLLLTAGFFGVVLSKTPLANSINHLWVEIAETSILLLILLTIVLISLLAFVGIHQIVTISAIIATVSYDQLGIHVITMAMMLLSSWGVAATISPLSPVVIVVSNMVKENIFKVIRWNLLYAITLVIVHTIAIYLVHLILV